MACYKETQKEQGYFYGYYPDKANETDYLYLYRIKGLPYLKVGRTFDPDRRQGENQRRAASMHKNIHLLRGSSSKRRRRGGRGHRG